MDNIQNTTNAVCDQEHKDNSVVNNSTNTECTPTTTPEQPIKLGKILGIVFNILIFVLGTVMIVISLFGTKSETGLNIFGHTMMQVLSPSMDADPTEYEIPTMPAGSIVLMEALPSDKVARQEFLEELKVGDVLTFLSLEGASIGEIVSHRIIDINTIEIDEEEMFYFTTRGDANADIVTESFTEINVKGKIVWVNESAGVIYNALMNSSMIIFLVVIPAAVMFVFELIKVITIVNNAKLEKAKESNQSEIELLKKQVELLSQMAKSEAQDNIQQDE